MGYVPAKRAENVHGHTFRDCNVGCRVAHEMRRAPVPPSGSLAQTFRQLRTYSNVPIPGYQGHIRGKEAESIFGYRYKATNQLACEARSHLDEGTWGHP